jgi:transposase
VFVPLINLFRDRLLEQPLIHYDETTYQVLKEEGKTAQSKSYMWVGLAGEQGKRVVWAGTVPTSLLDDFSGYLVTVDIMQFVKQTVSRVLPAGHTHAENLMTC